MRRRAGQGRARGRTRRGERGRTGCGYELIAAAGDWKAAKAFGTDMRPVMIDRLPELGRKTAVRFDVTLTERDARCLLSKRTGATILPAGGARRNGQGACDRLSESLPTAAGTVAARETRGNLHLGRDFEGAMESLGGDWDRFRRSGGTPLVLERTRAKARALSFPLHGRALDGCGGSAAVRVAGGGRRRTALLEIAPGDLVRFGAPHHGLKFPVGTVVAVKEVEVAPGSVRLRGRAGEGMDMEFSLDEIADRREDVRLDHGYAQTISSARGEAADRVFLLADDKLTASMIRRAERFSGTVSTSTSTASRCSQETRRIILPNAGSVRRRRPALFPEGPEERGARERPGARPLLGRPARSAHAREIGEVRLYCRREPRVRYDHRPLVTE